MAINVPNIDYKEPKYRISDEVLLIDLTPELVALRSLEKIIFSQINIGSCALSIHRANSRGIQGANKETAHHGIDVIQLNFIGG
jgi:hypothetical protein